MGMRGRRPSLLLLATLFFGGCAGTAEVPPEYPPLEAPPRELAPQAYAGDAGAAVNAPEAQTPAPAPSK
jgi:hypothetical protein